jgi:hypothetical protein
MRREATCPEERMYLLLLLNTASAASPGELSFAGFMDFEFEKTLAGAGGDQNGSFDLHHLNLLTSYQVDDALVVRTQIEWEHAFDFEAGGGQLRLEYGFAEYRLVDALRLRVGRVLTPFGLYNELHDATPTFNTYTIPYTTYAPHKLGGAPFFPKFQTAVMGLGDVFFGRQGVLHYDLFVGQGTNVSEWEGEADDNTNKSLGANLTLSPISSLSLQASGYRELEPTLGEDGEVSEAEIPVTTGYLALAFQRKVLLEVEGVYGLRGASAQWGLNGMVSVEIRERVSPYSRYSLLQPVGVRTWENGVALRVRESVLLKSEVYYVQPEAEASYLESRSCVSVAF